MPGTIQPEDQRPHFFLSYARSRYRQEGADPDRWMTKLYKDLCEDLVQLEVGVPGFMDRQQIQLGSSWPDRLADGLANCRVFVAMFSPAYFNSDYCGKEWAAFSERADQLAGLDRPSPIIPVLWAPMRLEGLPACVRDMQHVPPGFPDVYATEGLYAIMKVARYRRHYQETVYKLAQLIGERARQCGLSAGEISDLESLHSPFADDAHPTPRQSIRLTVAAPHNGQLPEGRDSYYYGRSVYEWNPYRSPTHQIPIGAYAKEMVGGMGHHSVLDSIEEPDENTEDSPRVLLVDPWATGAPSIRDRLGRLDAAPVNVVVPYNAEDAQTNAAATEFKAELAKVLPQSIALKGSAHHVPSLSAFDEVLSEAVAESIRRFLQTTDTYPPQKETSFQRKPRIEGPDAGLGVRDVGMHRGDHQ